MRLPSLDSLAQNILRTLRRFPLVILLAVAGTMAGVVLIEHEGPSRPTILFNILCASVLGIPFLTALVLIAERRAWNTGRVFLLQACGILLIAAYALTIPTTLAGGPAFHLQRLFALTIAAIMLVSVGPFLWSEDRGQFWPFNTTLLFRILAALLYSHVLFAGLSLAIAALDQLLGIDIPVKRYGELWAVTFGVLNTMLFLGGIPGDLRNLPTAEDVPKGLKVFVNYALIPIAAIYVVIAYAYAIKIVALWTWSEGWIGKLILGYAASGIAALVFLDPMKDRSDHGWIKTLSRWFILLLIPLALLLPFAIVKRISLYGVTEPRYAALALAGWLIAFVLYVLFSSRRDLRVIPASLGVCALLTVWGPWGMFHVSEQSQTHRLQKVLESNGLLTEGKVRKAQAQIPHSESRQISAILSYLHEVHGFDGIQPWFGQDLRKDPHGSEPGWVDAADVANMMGIDFTRAWGSGEHGILALSVEPNATLDVRGYDRMCRFQYVNGSNRVRMLREEGLRCEFTAALDSLTVTVMRGTGEGSTVVLPLRPTIEAVIDHYGRESIGNVPMERMTITAASHHLEVKGCLRSFEVRHRNDSAEILAVSIDILYRQF